MSKAPLARSDRQRISRAEQTERNRVAVLEAARNAFLEFGYHGTTVEVIARQVGMTIGAIYSRFSGKADLFLALLEERIVERGREFAQVARAAGGSPARAFAQRWASSLQSDLQWQLLVIEFRIHAARDPDLSRRYAELHDRTLAQFTDNIAASLPPDADASRGRVEELARAALAASSGAALARAAEGDAFSDELYVEISRALGQRFLGVEQA